jgi:hypothetical protein
MLSAPRTSKKACVVIFAATLVMFLLVTAWLMVTVFAHASDDPSMRGPSALLNVVLFPMQPLAAIDKRHPISEGLYDCLFLATWLVTAAFWAMVPVLLLRSYEKLRAKFV